MKKALCLASMASNLDNFNRDNVKILLSLGYEVTLASNFNSLDDTNSKEKIDHFVSEMKAMGVNIVQIDFSRKIFDIRGNIKSFKQVENLIKQGFDIIHCHAPICAAITRLCARKSQISGISKVIYTAHGFHFYDGAPFLNWLIYYPVEKHLSKYTDVLITINKEDYKRAKDKFYSKQIVYIPGVGVDVSGFCINSNNNIRNELGLSSSDIFALSVGELNKNKNHIVFIKAMIKLYNSGLLPENFFYVIVVKGTYDKELKELCRLGGLLDRVMFLGFRDDVKSFYSEADFFVFPSFREGLSKSLMEAMASGLPVICSEIRGNTDLIDNEGGFFINPKSVDSVAESISKMIASDRTRYGEHNIQKIHSFDITNVNKIMKSIYTEL